MRILVYALLTLAALPAPAFAQTPKAAIMWEAGQLPEVRPVQVPLTSATVERFIESLPTLIALARDFDREQGRPGRVRLDENLAFLLLPYLFDPAIERRIDGELQDLGFGSYADWANVAHSVNLAVEVAEFTGAIDLGSQEEAARRDIQEDPKLTPEQKAKALKELRSQFAALAEYEPLPGNREVVAPFLDRLRAAKGF